MHVFSAVWEAAERVLMRDCGGLGKDPRPPLLRCERSPARKRIPFGRHVAVVRGWVLPGVVATGWQACSCPYGMR
jgi:hypothetical protein